MSKLLVVFGATGNQGGSVIDYVLTDPTLSHQFKIRAITRDTTSASATALSTKGVEVVAANLDDQSSLETALKGAHTVFLVTVSVYDAQLKERELRQGKAAADAAVAVGAEYIIFSTLTHAGKGSGGKLTQMQHFDSKAEVEEYICGLPIKSAFFAPGSFMQNFGHFMAPQPLGEEGGGGYAVFNFVKPETQLPLIDIGETGKWVGAALAEPEKYDGKVFAAATGLWTFQECAEVMGKMSGKKVVYKQLPQEVFAGFLPEAMRPHIVEMFLWIQDYGYYGEGTEEKVEWAASNARGKLTSFEEYLQKNPLQLK